MVATIRRGFSQNETTVFPEHGSKGGHRLVEPHTPGRLFRAAGQEISPNFSDALHPGLVPVFEDEPAATQNQIKVLRNLEQQECHVKLL